MRNAIFWITRLWAACSTSTGKRTNDWGFHLWALLNLSLWYERWIDYPLR